MRSPRVPGEPGVRVHPRDPALEDHDALLERFRASADRSRARRAAPIRRRRAGVLVSCIAVVCGVVVIAALQRPEGQPAHWPANDREDKARAQGEPRAVAGAARRFPRARAVKLASRFALGRGGLVSFAIIDTRGNLLGRNIARRYVSASVVKAMLLAAELRRLEQAGLALDVSGKRWLTLMITVSDNASADAIYARVGDAGLYRVARLAGMRRFSVSGHWTMAQVTAGDLARFFYRLRTIVPRRYRRLALRLLGSVTPAQRWGIPEAAGEHWRIHFKGGWRGTERGELVHQAAWLHNPRHELAIAILTDGQPSQAYAIETVHGIAERLLLECRLDCGYVDEPREP
jgi:hypothetical protein